MKVPVYDVDIYSDSAILEPYPLYAAMRELGPLVFLRQHDIYAIPRYDEAKKALLGHNRFISGKGVAGFEWPARPGPNSTLATDEPVHSRFRSIIGAPLLVPALEKLTEQIETAADDLVARLVQQGDFDGMADFARFLPVSIVSTLVGLPEHGRQRMLEWASAAFDLLGVGNARSAAAASITGEMMRYAMTECRPDSVAPGSWASQIWEAVAAGRVTAEEGVMLHVDILAPSLDTTIFATGHLLHQLAINPDQWQLLKAEPSLVPAAIDEAIRLESPIRAFARVAEGDQDVGGTTLPDGARVLIMYASANRDERRWTDPERFWIERPGLTGHLGFGQGRHICAGMHLAKLEMRSLLKSILRRVDRIEVGKPQRSLNNTLRGFDSLPARFKAVA